MDILTPLTYPLIMTASGIYAGCSCLRRRWRRARGYLPTDVYPGSARQAVDRLRVREAALVDEVAIARTARAELLAQVRSGQDLDVVLPPDVEADLVVRAAYQRLGHLYVAPANAQQ